MTVPDPAAEHDPRPQVAPPASGVPTWALGLGACAIGMALLLVASLYPIIVDTGMF